MDETQKINTGEFVKQQLLSEEVRLIQLEHDISELKQEIAQLRTDVQDLIYAWKTATGVVSFIKWLAGVVTAVGALWLFFKSGVKS